MSLLQFVLVETLDVERFLPLRQDLSFLLSLRLLLRSPLSVLLDVRFNERVK